MLRLAFHLNRSAKMKRWKKEALVCLGCGAAIVGLLVGLSEIFGAKFGPCGPANNAAIFSILAVLPGVPVIGFLPQGAGDHWFSEIALFGAAICGYALPVWVVRWIFRQRSTLKQDD